MSKQVGKQVGTVYLVGAGPGDPGLLTRRGAELLGRADVIVYDGLIGPGLLDLARPDAERIYAGKKRAPQGSPLTQEQINDVLIARARAGHQVVRLKGGDAFVFGRGAEECAALFRAGVGFEVVPGVTSATAVPAYAGIPLTARGMTSTVAFATGHQAAGKSDSDVDWNALARAGTVVLFMALSTLDECCRELEAAGRAPDTPAAAIYWGTTARQKVVVSTLGELPRTVRGLKPPVLVIVGEVVSLRSELSWCESRPLFGARVLIPRPDEQSRGQRGGFAHALAELGAETLAMPVTRIVAPSDSERATIERLMDELASYDWILFTSGNAVTWFMAALAGRRRDARALARCRIACVGKATARALAEHGLIADLMPERGNAAGVAEAVLAAEATSNPGPASGLRVLLPRAARGRDEAVDVLTRAGARVDVMPVYRSEAVSADDLALGPAGDPAVDPALGHALARLRGRAGDAVDVVAFFAPSQVRALMDLLGPDAQRILSGCRVIAAIGDTTRAALTERGVDVHVVASSPDAGLLAREIASYYQRSSGSAPAAMAPAKVPATAKKEP